MNPNDYREAINHLRKGDVILFQTDNDWSLGCDIRQEKAVEKLLQIKQNTDNQYFTILISKIEQLSEYLTEVPEIAWNLVEFTEKPLTVIYPGGKNVAPNLIGENKTLALRLLKDEFCKGLVYRLERGIASISATIGTQPSPKFFADISPDILNNVDYILKNPKGENPFAQPSQIIKIGLYGEFEVIRK